MKHCEKKVFISTGAFGRRPIPQILEISSWNNISYLELSSDAVFKESDWPHVVSLAQNRTFHFLIHNYFPTPQVPFVLNLASADSKILRLSREHCQKAIDCCVQIGAPFYSVHSGFCFNAQPMHLGQKQTSLNRISKTEAQEIFIESVRSLADYAALNHLSILLENNVLTSVNLVQGRNETLLFVEADEIVGTIEKINKQNVGFLLDVGHLKVSARSLNIDCGGFFDQVSPVLKAVHLSDNNGESDSNQKITADSWFWRPLMNRASLDIHWILEVYNLSPEEIVQQLSLAEALIQKGVLT